MESAPLGPLCNPGGFFLVCALSRPTVALGASVVVFATTSCPACGSSNGSNLFSHLTGLLTNGLSLDRTPPNWPPITACGLDAILALLAAANRRPFAAGMPSPQAAMAGALSLMCQRPVATKTGASANNWGWDAIVARRSWILADTRPRPRPSARDCRIRCRCRSLPCPRQGRAEQGR